VADSRAVGPVDIREVAQAVAADIQEAGPEERVPTPEIESDSRGEGGASHAQELGHCRADAGLWCARSAFGSSGREPSCSVCDGRCEAFTVGDRAVPQRRQNFAGPLKSVPQLRQRSPSRTVVVSTSPPPVSRRARALVVRCLLPAIYSTFPVLGNSSD